MASVEESACGVEDFDGEGGFCAFYEDCAVGCHADSGLNGSCGAFESGGFCLHNIFKVAPGLGLLIRFLAAHRHKERSLVQNFVRKSKTFFYCQGCFPQAVDGLEIDAIYKSIRAYGRN